MLFFYRKNIILCKSSFTEWVENYRFSWSDSKGQIPYQIFFRGQQNMQLCCQQLFPKTKKRITCKYHRNWYVIILFTWITSFTFHMQGKYAGKNKRFWVGQILMERCWKEDLTYESIKWNYFINVIKEGIEALRCPYS